MKRLFLGLLFCLSFLGRAEANCHVTLPFNLTPNTTASATQVMANFNAIATAMLNTCAGAGVNSDITALTNAISIVGLPGLSAVVTANGTQVSFSGAGLQLTQTTIPWVLTATVTNSANDIGSATAGEGILSVAKYTNYSVAGLTTGVGSAIMGVNEVRDGVWGNTVGVYGQVNNFNTQHSQPASTASAVGVTGVGACHVANCAATWGGLASGVDLSGAANPVNPFYGMEIDNYANGADTLQNRIGLQIVAGRPAGVGAANTVSHGLLFTADAGNGTFGNMINVSAGTTAVNGLNFQSLTPSSSYMTMPGFGVNANGTVVYGAPGAGLNQMTVLGTAAQSVLKASAGTTFVNGIDLNSGTFSGFAFLSPGFALTGTGDMATRIMRPNIFTVATLPACLVGTQGYMAEISDLAVAPAYNTPIGAGGGVNFSLVICQGGAWTSH